MVGFQIIVNDALNGALEQWRCLLALSISLTGFLARTDVLKPLDSFQASSGKIGQEGGSEYHFLYLLWLWVGLFKKRQV